MILMDDVFKTIESFGVSREDLTKALDTKEPWGKMVHSFVYLTVLGCIESEWRKAEDIGKIEPGVYGEGDDAVEVGE
jgi:hypothetical protein